MEMITWIKELFVLFWPTWDELEMNHATQNITTLTTIKHVEYDQHDSD